jgi:CBS domain-containing protein
MPAFGTTSTPPPERKGADGMRTIDRLRRSGVGIGPDRTIGEAAAVMEQAGVGAVVIIDGTRLVGIVTDRDLVRRGLARGLPSDSRVDGVMSAPVVTIDAEADLHDAFALFRSHALRRLAVVRDGDFAGVITVDDLLIDLAGDLADLARPVTAEVLLGQRDAPLPVSS